MHGARWAWIILFRDPPEDAFPDRRYTDYRQVHNA
jgi:hypothetical protein